MTYARWLLLPLLALTAPAEEALPTGHESFFTRALALNHLEEPEIDDQAANAAFEGLVERCRDGLRDAASPAEKVAALNRAILVDRQVSYRSQQQWRDGTLAAALLRSRCNCIAGATLYVAVGERLQLPIRLVLIPWHAFARWDDGETRINIETTAKGVALTDDHYLYDMSRCDPGDARAIGWGRSLDPDQALSVLLEEAARLRLLQAKNDEAVDLLERAVRCTPERVDLALERLETLASLPGRRDEARSGIAALLARRPPPTVAADALLFQATDEALHRRFDRELALAQAAYQIAPKSSEIGALARMMSCYRSLYDSRSQRRFAELVLALTPGGNQAKIGALYDLAMAQREDGDLDAAMKTLDLAMKADPEAFYARTLRAGYLIASGHRDQGLAEYAAIPRPRDLTMMHDCMACWIACVSRDNEAFYERLVKVLGEDGSGYALEWIDQDPDLAAYSQEARFRELIERHRADVLQEDPQPGKGR
jgi:tetratricopeptide (TPR) repeat protein